MDTTTTYQDIIKQVILKYAQFRPSHGNIRLDPVFDEKHDRYILMQVGWDRGRNAIKLRINSFSFNRIFDWSAYIFWCRKKT